MAALSTQMDRNCISKLSSAAGRVIDFKRMLSNGGCSFLPPSLLEQRTATNKILDTFSTQERQARLI